MFLSFLDLTSIPMRVRSRKLRNVSFHHLDEVFLAQNKIAPYKT